MSSHALSSQALLFTPAEASVLAGVPLKAVNNAIDRKTIPARVERFAGRLVRLLAEPALLYLSLERRLAEDTTPRFRRKLYQEIERLSADRAEIAEIGALKVDLREPRRKVAQAVDALRRAKELVTIDPETMGGEPVFIGTRVQVHLIASLIEMGETDDVLAESYPRVSAEMRSLAPLYAAAYPRPAKPRRQPWHGQKPIKISYSILPPPSGT